jgi:hypothetical protein
MTTTALQWSERLHQVAYRTGCVRDPCVALMIEIVKGIMDAAACDALALPFPDVEVTDEEAAAMRARVEATLKGRPAPWHYAIFSPASDRQVCQVWDDETMTQVTTHDRGIAQFIASSVTDIPRLLDDRERLNAILRDLAQDSPGEQYEAGRRAGIAEGERLMAKRVIEAQTTEGRSCSHCFGSGVSSPSDGADLCRWCGGKGRVTT